jgi:glycosyltransferase involved in cell wall biosynthesis
MNPASLISVIMPARNAGAWIDVALASALSQTQARLEVIVIEDHSTDDTRERVQRIAAADSRVILLDPPPGGGRVAAARNWGLRQARGEWVAFLDADDVWLPGKLEKQLRLAAEDSRANLIYTNYWLWDGERDLELRYAEDAPWREGEVTEPLIRWCLFGNSSVLVRRQALEAIGGYDTTLPGVEDWDLWLRLAEQGLWVRGLREPCLRYRIWDGNLHRDRVHVHTGEVQIFEKALTRVQPPRRKRLYRAALARARGNLELARARPRVETDVRALRQALACAWWQSPGRTRWLLWLAGAWLPEFLGGGPVRRRIVREIAARW